MARLGGPARFAADRPGPGVSARTKSTLPLFWTVADAFWRDPRGWETSHVRFELRRRFEIDGTRWIMSARLGCSTGPLKSGFGARGRLLSIPYIHLWSPLMTKAREARMRELGTFERLAELFANRGYTVGWDDELNRKLAWASPRPAITGIDGHMAEREWLEQALEDRSLGHRYRHPKVSRESLWSVLDSFRGRNAGPWVPAVFEFTKTCPFHVDGNVIGAPLLDVRVSRRDQGWPTARSPATASAGVEFIMRELSNEDRKRLRRRGWFAAAATELGRHGFRGEWYRFQKGVQPLGAFWRGPLLSAAQVVRERERLARLVDGLLVN